ncbi:SRPBCC domain-containing protein [Shewanella sp. Pdp11]|uniref:SRPBCC domain-containing protein n=1 Tax=Shewanella sp. Pdp11 TaxID=2059264 RepID=UPI001E48CC57|nr:SRPBCC domain-containing protein [Shewanella sp. Pdp11]
MTQLQLTRPLSQISNGGKYTARVLHWNSEDRQNHEDMGFHPGWSKATDQLEELVATL